VNSDQLSVATNGISEAASQALAGGAEEAEAAPAVTVGATAGGEVGAVGVAVRPFGGPALLGARVAVHAAMLAVASIATPIRMTRLRPIARIPPPV
jgi:L-fucose isomerase-like protein